LSFGWVIWKFGYFFVGGEDIMEGGYLGLEVAEVVGTGHIEDLLFCEGEGFDFFLVPFGDGEAQVVGLHRCSFIRLKWIV
jgi:hypothetical protein